MKKVFDGGKDFISCYEAEDWCDRAIDIFAAAGIKFEYLSTDTQGYVIREMLKSFCPNCGIEKTAFQESHYQCKCGWNWSTYFGWKIK